MRIYTRFLHRPFSYTGDRHEATSFDTGCAIFNEPHPKQKKHAMALITYLVEDSATIRENLISTLEEIAPVKVVGFAETESEASQWLLANNGDWQLAIVDLFLKEGSGLGVLRNCRHRKDYQKVVVLTNYATQDIRERCAELGSDAVFDKSNELDELLDYCRNTTTSNTSH